MAEGSLHIVVFPWLAFGHMIPFLELSKSLAKRGHHISFLSTPRNILRLPKLPPTLPPLIDFIPIHLPPSDDLPDNAEATIDLLPADVEHLKKAYDGLHQPMAKFMEQASPRPDWIIQDFVPHWVSPIAAELHIPCAMLNLFPAYFNAFLYGPDGVGMWRSAEQLIVARPSGSASRRQLLTAPSRPGSSIPCCKTIPRGCPPPTVSIWSSDGASSWLCEVAWNGINNCYAPSRSFSTGLSSRSACFLLLSTREERRWLTLPGRTFSGGWTNGLPGPLHMFLWGVRRR